MNSLALFLLSLPSRYNSLADATRPFSEQATPAAFGNY